MARKVEIVGGGLAGLSLGVALAERGVSVELWEAGELPRHRVCGEFICGVRPETLEALRISDDLADALVHREGWWNGPDGRRFFSCRLPRPAYGISRYRLDLRLVDRLRRAGGTVHVGTRWRKGPAGEGTVFASGRSAGRTPWMGFKIHVSGDHPRGLSLFLGDGGYVGLSPVEDGYWNLCGLFRKRTDVRAGKEEILGAYAEANRMNGVLDVLNRSTIREGSAAGVAGVSFEVEPFVENEIRIGDAWGVIPPFTGNGMSIAFESAETAVEPLMEWARGRTDWRMASREIDRAHRRRFSTRFRVANRLHPWLMGPSRRKILRSLAGMRVLPFRALFALTH